MRMEWMVLICWIFAMSWNVRESSLVDCVAQGESQICYGSQAAADGFDWLIETRDGSGRTQRFTERLPYDQEIDRVAVSIREGWIAFVVHSRWIDEFQMRWEIKWELILFDADGSIRTRVNLLGRPASLFDALGYLVVRNSDGKVRTYDASLNSSVGLPPPIAVSMKDVSAILPVVTWKTPSGDDDTYDGVGLYLVEWTASDGCLRLPVTVVADIRGLEDEKTYLSPIRWESDWPVSIDGRSTVRSGIIDVPGFHGLVVEGKNGYRMEWTVLLEPRLYGLPSGPSLQPVRLYSDASMTVNQQPYVSGTPIERAGRYELVLKAAGGYSKTVAFVIASGVFGVTEGGVYEAPFAFHVNGSGLLNGRTVSGETRILEPGSYQLAFWEDGMEPRFVSFRVTSSSPPPSKPDSLAIVQIGLAILGLIGLYFVRKRKSPPGSL